MPLNPNFIFPAVKGQSHSKFASDDCKGRNVSPENIRRRVSASVSSATTKALTWVREKRTSFTKENTCGERRFSAGDAVNLERRSSFPPPAKSSGQWSKAGEVRSSKLCAFSASVLRRSSDLVTRAERQHIAEAYEPQASRKTRRGSDVNRGVRHLPEPSIRPPAEWATMRDQYRNLHGPSTLPEIDCPAPEQQCQRCSHRLSQPAPPIRWETRPTPMRPFRPVGECDQEIAALQNPGRVQSFSQSHLWHKPAFEGLSAVPSVRPASSATFHSTPSVYSLPSCGDYSLPSGETYQFSMFTTRHSDPFDSGRTVATARSSGTYVPAQRQLN